MTDSELQHSCDCDVDALGSSGEEPKELMITVCDIWRSQSLCSFSGLWSDSQDTAEVIHLTVDSLQGTSLKGSHAAFRVGSALLCPTAG